MDEVRSYWQVASINHFCTLFNKYFKLPDLEPEELEQAFILDLNVTSIQNPKLVDLAIALLEPHFNTKLNYNNWENYLYRIIESNWVQLEQYPSPLRRSIIKPDGEEICEDLGFNDLPLSDKIDVIHALCDYRLWCEDVQDKLKDLPIEELRLESIGKDSQGYEYWYFSGTRLFRENKELSADIVARKKRIIELEDRLVEFDKTRLIREQEEKRKAELEKARQLAAEAREAKRKQQEQETRSKRKQATPILPPRTGLRERRSSATSNNNHHIDNNQNNRNSRSNNKNESNTQEEIRIPTTRSKVAKQTVQQNQQETQTNDETTNRSNNTRQSLTRNRASGKRNEAKSPSPNLAKKSPEEECREELEKIQIKLDERKEAWSIQCESLEEWEEFVIKFEKTKSTNEKYLFNCLNEFVLPQVRAIYAKRAADVRRKEKELLYSLASRRVSTRLVSRRVQEEEDEKQALVHEAEMRRKKAEAEDRLRAELEREMRIRQNRFVINGVGSTCSEEGDEYSNSRYNLRQHQELLETDEFAGIIHPDKLAEFYEALELIVDSVRTSKHAWPFVDPVPDSVPGYYDLIDQPMDLRKLRTKIEFREYKSIIELEKDFQLIVNNCERFNGPKNTYTKMVYKLWKSFRKNVRLYLQRDLAMDEFETFIYPPKSSSAPACDTQQQPELEHQKPQSIESFEPCEDIIIDSYDVTCPDQNFFIA